MTLQIIKSLDGKEEYALLPIAAYNSLKPQIHKVLEADYVEFDIYDYVQNPVALARIEANLTQEELAKKMGVTQAYISKLENQESVTAKVLKKVQDILPPRKHT
jgi:DNA-binding XRE family transcriptional regulator